MTKLTALAGKGVITTHGKELIARSMYEKGKGFIGAALLLRQQGGYEYVVLHLVCQGLGIVMKALLLFKNYDFYSGRVKKDFHHDLKKLMTTVSRIWHATDITGTCYGT
jgi:hypothetical protein